MSSIQIPNLPAVIGLSGAELFEGVQAGASVKISLNQMIAATRAGLPTTLPIPVSLGGTGASNAATARTNLGAAPSADPAFTGQASFADGTAAAPSITHTGDLNSGLFFPAADTVAVATAGVERMRVDSAGNVGIGGTPATQLDLAANNTAGTALNVLRFTDTDLSATGPQELGKIEFYSADNSAPGAGVKASITGIAEVGNPGGGIAFSTDLLTGTPIERMRVDRNGNVGIGGTPAAWNSAYKSLNIANAYSGIASNGSNRIQMGQNYYIDSTGATLYGITSLAALYYQSSGIHQWYTAPSGTAGTAIAFTQVMTLTNGGNLGIGTTSPLAKVHSQVNTFTTADMVAYKAYNNQAVGVYANFQNSATGTAITDGFLIGINDSEDVVLSNYEATNMMFATNSTERMRIDSSGNVGIGTTSPTTLLSVDGGTYNQTNYAASALMKLQYASGTKAAPTAVSVSSALGIFAASGYDGVSAYRSTGQIAFYSDGAISPTSAPGLMILYTTPTGTVTPVERLRLGSAGQFGIGGANYGTSGQTIISAGSGAAPAWGAVGAAGGGTGITSYTIGDIVYASGTTTLSKLADVATGNALISGGVGVAPSYGKIGLTTHVSGTLPVANGGTGVTTAPAAAAALLGYTSTPTAAGTTVLTNTSTQYQLFTGATTQTITLPVTSTLGTGWSFHIVNNSTGSLTVNSSGGNLVTTIISGVTAMVTCIGTTLTTAADWEAGFTDFQTLTGTGAVVLASAPAITGGSIDNMTVGATTQASVRGTSLVSNSVITDGFITHANGTLALAFATDGVAQVTPNATGTFTTTVPAAGTRCTLIVLTSGTTSYTMTFGTGFKTTGTLATGTVSARYFIFQFISDGTSVIEASRTVAIA
jgi:hypothetical protein